MATQELSFQRTWRPLTGPSSTPFNEDLWFGKLTWQLGDASLIELSVKRREESEIKDIGDQNTESYGKTNNNDSTRYDLRYQWSGVNWLNDAHLTYEDEAFNPRAINIGPGSTCRTIIAARFLTTVAVRISRTRARMVGASRTT